MCSVIFPGNKGEARIESATMHTPSVLRGDFCLNNLLLLLFLAFVLQRDLLDAGREKKKKRESCSFDLVGQERQRGKRAASLFHPVWCIHFLKIWVTVYFLWNENNHSSMGRLYLFFLLFCSLLLHSSVSF